MKRKVLVSLGIKIPVPLALKVGVRCNNYADSFYDVIIDFLEFGVRPLQGHDCFVKRWKIIEFNEAWMQVSELVIMPPLLLPDGRYNTC